MRELGTGQQNLSVGILEQYWKSSGVTAWGVLTSSGPAMMTGAPSTFSPSSRAVVLALTRLVRSCSQLGPAQSDSRAARLQSGGC